MEEKDTLKEEILSLISSTLEIDKNLLNDNTNLMKDLDLESLDLVDLIAAFETKYKIEINDADIKNIQTVGDIINYIKSHV